MTCPNPQCRHRFKRKLRPLVISIIPDENQDAPADDTHRYERITTMFTTHPSLSAHFEPPVFSSGVPSREIRNRLRLLQYCRRASLIPDVEWEAIARALREHHTPADVDEESDDNVDFISSIEQNQFEVIDPFKYLAETTEIVNEVADGNSLETKKKKWPQTRTTSLVPISPDRKGSEEDISVPYSLELWRKAKTLNRDRSVLGCTLAHLIAMKKLVDEDFDFILEDNVRAFVGNEFVDASVSESPGNWTGWSCECATRIWDIIESSDGIGKDDRQFEESSKLSVFHLRYFGWLGSLPNLSWVYNNHIPRKGYSVTDTMTIFPFPTNDDFDLDSIPTDKDAVKREKKTRTSKQIESSDNAPHFTVPGGTAVFGTFAYSISKEAYRSLIYNLQNDVGALMWKSKKMRAYHAKPIDKVLPRHVRSSFGEKCVHLPDKVAFVRCPMLGSLLHPQWEEGFCLSTELQYKLSSVNLTSLPERTVWGNVWLTNQERQRIEERLKRC